MTRGNRSSKLTGIVITLNEEMHIERCLGSLSGLCDHVLVVDSGSSDSTVAICRAMGAEVIHNRFVTHAAQVNAGIDYLTADDSRWLLRIDADEYLNRHQHEQVRVALAAAPQHVAGLELRRHIVFLGRRLRWGGLEPSPQLRLWRCGRGRSEQRWMDEHIVVEGAVRTTTIDLFDENLNNISWWTDKHNRYASREAVQILMHSTRKPGCTERLGRMAALKRILKEKVYNNLPLAARAFVYFFFRYIMLLGFLDGMPGLFFHFLQGCWYRVLVDSKVFEVRCAMTKGLSRRDAILARLGIDIGAEDGR
ncbi:glycosyltransferase family 2 protein [Stakelama saccharophila]|uniref:Glycosyltransferase family 2 protein n=1 Tax=Stakelama saccharophila TaxID=3075605 RepID=A0ABZ0B8N7_9SPHN|nr:glycosyltransferase family 2 protein [Stakelama sp. W311]WNO53781.1 glycosyltransferase family 2 protein [Stakelama sp. W311]